MTIRDDLMVARAKAPPGAELVFRVPVATLRRSGDLVEGDWTVTLGDAGAIDRTAESALKLLLERLP